METLWAILKEFSDTLYDWNSRLAIIYLLGTLPICWVIWRVMKPKKAFVSWLFPRDVYFHKSHLVDLKVFAFNAIVHGAGILSFLAITPIVADAVGDLLGGIAKPNSLVEADWITGVWATLVILMTADFCVYWTHRLHHETSVLWPFHSVHHSAEVLTPITVHRKHPVYNMISMLIRGVLLGAVFGVILFLVVGDVPLVLIGSVNAGYFIFNMIGANLRHSHVWLSYGPTLEHIFISPAQHQIHHSSDVKHHNKNYGEVFAFWDWMFGTLYVPDSYEDLKYGISDEHGNEIPQPHPTLRAALIEPFRDSWQALWKGTSRDPEADPSETKIT